MASMKFEWKKNSPISVEYKIIIPNKKVLEKEKEARKEIVRNIKIPGFRANAKLPKQLLAKYLTKGKILVESIRAWINDAYDFALEQAKKEDAPMPSDIPKVKIDLAKNDDGLIILTFNPEMKVKVPSLSTFNLKLDDEIYQVTPKKINAEIDRMKDQFATMVLRENDPVKKGDLVTIDFYGTLDGQPFEGGEAKNYELLIGSKKFLPGFEDKIIGMKTGEEKTFSIVFPTDYFIKHLQGMKIDFKVKLHEIKFKEPVKNDKEFIKMLNRDDVKTMVDVKKLAKKNLKDRLENQKEDDYWKATLVQAIEKGDFYYPEKILTTEFQKIKENAENNLKQKKLTLKTYAEVMSQDIKTILASMKKEAEMLIKKRLAVSGIANNLGIQVSDTDIIEYAKEILTNNTIEWNQDQLNRFIKSQRNAIFNLLVEKKAREDIVDLMKRSMKAKEIDIKPKKVKKSKKQTKKTASSIKSSKKEKKKTKKKSSPKSISKKTSVAVKKKTIKEKK